MGRIQNLLETPRPQGRHQGSCGFLAVIHIPVTQIPASVHAQFQRLKPSRSSGQSVDSKPPYFSRSSMCRLSSTVLWTQNTGFGIQFRRLEAHSWNVQKCIWQSDTRSWNCFKILGGAGWRGINKSGVAKSWQLLAKLTTGWWILEDVLYDPLCFCVCLKLKVKKKRKEAHSLVSGTMSKKTITPYGTSAVRHKRE